MHSLFLLLLCLLSSLCLAADPPAAAEPGEVVDHLVVTATRSAEAVETIAGTVQVIDGDAVRAHMQPGQSLGDALGKLIPGLGTSTLVRTNYTQTLRGRDTLVLIDGVPQNDNRKISRELDTISPENIQRIEVLSGATAVHGSGAMGGIINIITRNPGGAAFEARTSVGSSTATDPLSGDGTHLRLAQSLSLRRDAWSAYLGASFERRRGDYDADGRRIAPEPAQTSLADSDFRDLQLKLGYQIDGNRSLQLFVQDYADTQDSTYAPNYGGPGVPILLGAPADNFAVDGMQLDRQPHTDRRAISLSYTDADFLGHVLDARIFHRTRDFRFFPFPQALPVNSAGIVVSQSTSEAEVYGLRLQLDRDLGTRTHVTWGVDHQVDKGRQRATTYDPFAFIASGGLNYVPQGTNYSYGPDVDTTQTGPFVQVRYQPGERWTLRAGLRGELVDAEVGTATSIIEALAFDGGLIPYTTPLQGDTLSYDTLVFNGGVVYALPHGELFAGYAQGYELPDAARLLRNALDPNSLLVLSGSYPGGTLVSDSELEAIEIESYELAWRTRYKRVRAHISLFANQSDKTVAFNPDYTVSILPEEKSVRGLELAVSGGEDTGLRWSLGFAHTVGERKDALLGDVALSAAEIPPNKWTGLLGYRTAGNLDMALSVLHLQDDDRAHRDTAREAAIEGYTTLDGLVRWTWGASRISAGVLNLTDTDYQSVYSQWAAATYGPIADLPAPGRSLSVSWSVTY